MPPTNACAPTRANWMTAAPPPRMAKSPMVTVARQHDVVGEDDVAADLAVVADVAVGEEGAAVADDGRHAAALGARVHGHAFADQAVAADLQRRGLAFVLEVLRLVADRGEREDARPGADGRAAGDDGVAHQLDLVSQHDVLADVAEGTDAHTVAEPGSRLDDRGGMDLTSWHHPDPGSWR